MAGADIEADYVIAEKAAHLILGKRAASAMAA
jgi:hypothetical protein